MTPADFATDNDGVAARALLDAAAAAALNGWLREPGQNLQTLRLGQFVPERLPT